MKRDNLKLIHGLEELPKNALASEIFTVSEYARKKIISLSAIYARITRVVFEKSQKWDEYKAFRKGFDIRIMEIKKRKKKK